MGILRSFSFGGFDGDMSAQSTLTPAQQRMYKQEKLINFRLIARALQSHAPTILTPSHLISEDLRKELQDLGQFAELTYSTIPLDFVFEHIETLTGERFPLEGYHALRDSKLISPFRSDRADLLVYLAYRRSTKQLIMAISGTVTLTQVYYDLSANLRSYPSSSKCRVHSGFWSMYSSFQVRAISEIQANIAKYDVQDLVLVGHSMGGALAYFLAIDLLKMPSKSTPLVTVLSFGCPRVGDQKFVDYWNQTKAEYLSEHGANSLREFAVRGHNDGVPALPPLWMGYRHLSLSPLFFHHNRLYQIPEADHEYGAFPVQVAEDAEPPEHPRGGHNYYNGRDMERGARRMGWLEKALGKGNGDWEKRYRTIVERNEGVRP
jgi:pimeloyl-ACP methyl ester carboxylesterase